MQFHLSITAKREVDKEEQAKYEALGFDFSKGRWHEDSITIEIASLEELLAFVREYGGDWDMEKTIVLQAHGAEQCEYSIEIYNYYRE